MSKQVVYTCRRGGDDVAAGVPGAQRDAGGELRVRRVHVLQRHLHAQHALLPQRRRQVQYHPDVHRHPRRRRCVAGRRRDNEQREEEDDEDDGGDIEATTAAGSSRGGCCPPGAK